MTVLLSETKLLLLKLSIREDRVLFERRFIKHLGITSWLSFYSFDNKSEIERICDFKVKINNKQ